VIATDPSATLTPEEEVVAEIARLITKDVKSEPCVLVLGAGVHAPPPEGSRFSYPAESRPPLGSDLSELLSQKCGCKPDQRDHDPRDLQRAALCYEIRHERSGLVDAITDALAPTRPSPLLLGLTALPFPLIITTNFDTLIEKALQKNDKDPFVGVYSPKQEPTANFRDWSVDRPFLLKIHGSLSQRDSLVVTDEDYIQFVLRMRDQLIFDPIPDAFRYHLTRSTNLFIGYSLMDYNLRLLFKTVRWGKDDADLPRAYSIDNRPDRLIRNVWETRRRYINFVVENHWDFIPRLYKAVTGNEMPA
jgi:SIR2-like protein